MDGGEGHTGIDEVYDTAHPSCLTAAALVFAGSRSACICQQDHSDTRGGCDFQLRTLHCYDLRICYWRLHRSEGENISS